MRATQWNTDTHFWKQNNLFALLRAIRDVQQPRSIAIVGFSDSGFLAPLNIFHYHTSETEAVTDPVG
jgi:hypothetical protein